MVWIGLRRCVLPALVGVLIVIVLPGCGSTRGFERGIVLGELDAERFAERVLAGEATREEEQEFLRKNHLAWRALRVERGLIHPGIEGELAADFQELLGQCSTPVARDLAWAWLGLAVTRPDLDLRKSR